MFGPEPVRYPYASNAAAPDRIYRRQIRVSQAAFSLAAYWSPEKLHLPQQRSQNSDQPGDGSRRIPMRP
jgi:hypothetical protein